MLRSIHAYARTARTYTHIHSPSDRRRREHRPPGHARLRRQGQMVRPSSPDAPAIRSAPPPPHYRAMTRRRASAGRDRQGADHICSILCPAHRDAWKGVEGTSAEDAMTQYVEKLLEVRAATEPPPPFSDRRPPYPLPRARGVRRRARSRLRYLSAFLSLRSARRCGTGFADRWASART